MVIRNYTKVAQLDKNDAGLVDFPASGTGFSRYGGIQSPGCLSGEEIGSGDHWLKPKTAAALFGVIAEVRGEGVNNVAFGDMSTSTGSDPATPKTSTAKEFHHKGHGHFGRGSGMAADFRYINNDGYSFQNARATTSDDFSDDFNKQLYDAAKRFGFSANGQGPHGTIPGISKWPGHDDHGHLGLNPGATNFQNYKPFH
jgi:hypothetical protein